MMKCWLDELLDFWLPKPVEQDIDGEPVEDNWYVALPEIPPLYRRYIPVLEPDTMTPESADAYVRSGR